MDSRFINRPCCLNMLHYTRISFVQRCSGHFFRIFMDGTLPALSYWHYGNRAVLRMVSETKAKEGRYRMCM